MILTCSSCSTRFNVPDTALGAKGRTVRCGACRHEWFESAGAVDPQADIDSVFDSPPAEQAAELGGAEQAGEEARTEVLAFEREPQPRIVVGPAATPRSQRPGPWLGWTALASVVVAVLAATALLEDVVVELWPPAKRLYAMVGLPFGGASGGLEMHNIEARYEAGPDGPRLVIIGDIVNTSSEVRRVPPVRVVLRDAEQRDLEDWVFQATDMNMMPSETVPFSTYRESPATAAAGAALGFSNTSATTVPVAERAAARD